MASNRGTRFVLSLTAAFTLVAACAITAVCALIAPGAQAAKPANPNATLRIHPGGEPARFGTSQTLEAELSGPSGAGIPGAALDFEVTGGPGDQDGNTPETPDMTCTTAGGDQHHPATCRVSYATSSNLRGSDAVLAWVDEDGQDSTVEADLGEGENENAAGSGPCAPGTKGPGTTAEPDSTDCAEKRWLAIEASTLDFEPKGSSGPLGSVVNLRASVGDQFGAPFGAVGGLSTTVNFELLEGSAHDPGDGSDFGSPDLGTCVTGLDGTCEVPFTAGTGGTDTVCAYLPYASASCNRAPDAPGPGQGGSVVTRVWEAPAAPPSGEGSTSLPEEPAQTQAPVPTAAPQTSDEPKRTPAKEPAGSTKPDRDTANDHPRPEGSSSPAADPTPAPVAHSTPGGPAAAPRRATPAGHASPSARHRLRRHHAERPGRAGPTRQTRSEGRAAPASSGREAPAPGRKDGGVPTLGDLSHAALATANKLSFPLGLALLVVAFLVIQGRIDRRDPKLRLAPIDSKHDLLRFR